MDIPSKHVSLSKFSTVVADTADREAVKRLRPQDCTTNPTLVLKAIQAPEGGALLTEALDWGRRQTGTREAICNAIADRLAVGLGVELAGLVPGRVSSELDADLSFNVAASVARARELVADFAKRGIGRERILVKIAATWEGIAAAKILQKEEIDCNLTLVFSLAQAMACADAGVWLISPFVGRILDWHLNAGEGPYTAQNDPGVLSVRAIWKAFRARGVATIVMGASFRNTGQIEALAGCDRLTISPALLDALAGDHGPFVPALTEADLTDAPSWVSYEEPDFRLALNRDAMASEKLGEGIRLFSRDLGALKHLIAQKL
jgi:transaldolase